MNVSSRVYLSVFVVLISAIYYFVDIEGFKLLLSGHSSTYAVIFERNYLVFPLAFTIVGAAFLIKRIKARKYVLSLLLILWTISLKTKAIDLDRKKTIHGFMFLKIHESALTVEEPKIYQDKAIEL